MLLTSFPIMELIPLKSWSCSWFITYVLEEAHKKQHNKLVLRIICDHSLFFLLVLANRKSGKTNAWFPFLSLMIKRTHDCRLILERHWLDRSNRCSHNNPFKPFTFRYTNLHSQICNNLHRRKISLFLEQLLLVNT